MGSKGTTTTKKESYRDWKVIKEKKKKQDASNSDNDTLERGIVHRTGIDAIVSAKNWASGAISDDDDELLPSLGSISLAKREC